MIRALIPAVAGLTLLPVAELATDYTKERTLRIALETETSVEMTSMSVTRDGEPVDRGGRGGFGGGTTETTREVLYADTVMEHEDGAPTKVKRVFDEVGASSMSGDGEQARESDRESPMEGETLILTVDDEGDVVAEMEGGEPDDPAMLEGHSVTLPLDGLLPDGDVDEGDSWEPDKDALLAALGMDVESALFPRPEPQEGGGEGERGGRGRGGRGFGRGAGTGFFRDAEWDTKATLTGATSEVEGLECVVIELEFEAEGDLPEQERGGRDREAFLSPALVGTTIVESTFEVTLEGKLYFSIEAGRPVKLELEGEFTLEVSREFERQGSTTTMEMTQEGTFEHSVTITEEGL